MDLKIYPAVEREATTIPIQDILTEEGVPHIFPEIKSKAYFDIDFRGNQLVLVAGKYIGLIPINEWSAINVQPKVGVSSLVHIISKSREYLDSLHFFERYYKETSTTSPTIFEFFANCLTIELQKLELEGMLKQYIRKHANLSAPKSRINIGRTIARNWSKGLYYEVFCDYFEFTADNYYNRLIKFTLWYCLNHLVHTGSNNKKLIKTLSYYYNYFENITLDKNKKFLNHVVMNIHDQKIPALRIYYENLCKICRCIIEDIGIMLSSPGENVKMLSFIINMENVFEKYMLYVLRESKHIFGTDVTILDGNKEGKSYLFKDSKKYETKPDIIVRHEGKFKLIADAKYKKKTSESDRYQIISHALSYGVNKALLIMPLSDGINSPGLSRVGEVGHEFRVELYEYYFDLESNNLENEELAYVEGINELCRCA